MGASNDTNGPESGWQKIEPQYGVIQSHPDVSVTAVKAALAALGDNPALCLAEDPSSIVHALRAAYAVDFGSRPALAGSAMTHEERDRWRSERNDLRRTLWCVLRAGGGVTIPDGLLTAYDPNLAVLEWAKEIDGVRYAATELPGRVSGDQGAKP